jgi:hypothetical protein
MCMLRIEWSAVVTSADLSKRVPADADSLLGTVIFCSINETYIH